MSRPVEQLPNQTIRTNVWSNHQYHITGNRGEDPPIPPKATTFSQFLEIKLENIKWIWEQHRFDVDFTEVAQWIRDGD
jgi:hypothetical protein